jgi:hypothetical protein
MVVEAIPQVSNGAPELSLPGHDLPSKEILGEFQDEWLRTCAAL